MKSCSKISIPSKPATAMAGSLSRSVPDSETVAIEVRLAQAPSGAAIRAARSAA
jgi:hypothetical protein